VAHGVTEIALTEHLFRFTQARDRLGGFWDDLPGEALRPGMAAYWDHHARVDLDEYVEVVQAVKAEGLPVVLGLEVDFYQDRMDQVADLLAGYPFDVLLGSVHWLGTWRFDVLNDPLVLAEWDVRDVDAVWDEYTRAMEELGESGVCDVFAHPDLVKIAGRVPAVPDEFYDRMTEAAVRSGMAAELSSAGWRKPVGEEYPAPPLLERFVRAGVPLTTASDAHSLPDVADRADDLRGLLLSAGVTHLQGFRDRSAHRVPVQRPEEG
jgi:histidinol-phosphatase (PHP family)